MTLSFFMRCLHASAQNGGVTPSGVFTITILLTYPTCFIETKNTAHLNAKITAYKGHTEASQVVPCAESLSTIP